ncbi:MAG: hypothetical protein Q9207_001413 [Kuettlingeria erythrocarpa]
MSNLGKGPHHDPINAEDQGAIVNNILTYILIDDLNDLIKSIRTDDSGTCELYLRQNPGLAAASDHLGRTPLHYAAESGSLAFIRTILSDRSNVVELINAKTLNGETCLMLAASQGYHDIVAWLSNNRADSCIMSVNGKTALDEAVEAGFVHVVGLLLLRMTVKERSEFYLRSAGHSAHKSGKATVTGEKVLDPVYKASGQGDRNALSPLQSAIVQGDRHAISNLLGEDFVDIEDYLPSGEKPLMLAASSSQYGIIQLLLNHGADVNSTSAKGWTTLMHAVRDGNRAVVQQLINLGADVNHLSPDRWTALAEASYRGHRDITALLLQQGADTESRSSHDFTPLMHASYKGDEAVVKLLLEAGAHTDVSSFHDETATLLAAAGGYTSIVSMLLEAGAAPEPAWAQGPNDNSEEGKQQAKEKAVGEPEDRAHARGWTPLMLASQGGHQDIARILLERGVNRKVKSPHDKTALDIAFQNASPISDLRRTPSLKFAMGKKVKKRKEMDLKAAPWPETATRAGLPYVLDPDGDVLLILNSSSSIPEDAVHRFHNEEDIDKPANGENVAAESASKDLTVEGTMSAVEADEEQDPSQIFHVRVSPKHLILASPVFKRMLQISFKEGQQLSSQGHTELPLPDDNPAALLVLLNLIHGNTRKGASHNWLRDAHRTRHPGGQIRAPGDYGDDEINRSRQDTLSGIFAYLQGILEKYQGGTRIFPQGIECDWMLLGSLTMGLKAINILQPPLPPFSGFSVKGLLETLKEMRVAQYCNKNNNNLINSGYYSHSRGGICAEIKGPLEDKTGELVRKLQGLELTD